MFRVTVGVVVGLVVATIVMGGESESAGRWRAGVAKRVITPETGVWLAGYGARRPPDGKLHDLWVKALALDDGQGNCVVLITSDFQGVPKSMSDQVFARLEAVCGLQRRQVMFTFSHNHCGPRLGDDLVDYYPVDTGQERLVEEYTRLMIDRCVEVVQEAMANLVPVRLEQGVGKATFAVNRRNNHEAEVAELLARGAELKGPVDHEVPVLTVTAETGTIMAVLFGYACHPTTLSFNSWCGDYPGFAQLELERQYPDALAMFVNTCGGDQNPLPRRSVELCRKYGMELANAVKGVVESRTLTNVKCGIRDCFEYVKLPYLSVVSRDELLQFVDDGNPIRARWARRMLTRLDRGEVFEAEYAYPLHVWQLGNEMLVIGMGAEVVVDYALRFKKEFGPGTWVCGYTDDMISYIPSRRVWEEGGYEGGANLFEYGRPALRWSGDIEDRLVTNVERMVKDVRRAR